MKKFITIEGNIGAGKSSLAQHLSKTFNAFYIPEEFEKNPLLKHFYEKPEAFSFALEFSFLLDRYRQLFSLREKINNSVCISDYSFEKCLLFAKLNLSSENFLFFEKQFHFLKQDLPESDVRIFIHVTPEKAKENISKRGREMEQTLKSEYLESIGNAYLKMAEEAHEGHTLLFRINQGNDEAYKRLYNECVSVLKSDSKSGFWDYDLSS